MENVSKVCIVVGALLTGVGAIMGALFMTSGDFVIARISCINSTENGDECPSDGFVQFEGSDCQIGNLGLFESAFTPGCADDTPYSINPFVGAFEGDPLEFGPLFPAQTGLAGIVPGFASVNSQSVVPEFESCESYFSASGDLATFFTDNGFFGIFGQTEVIDSTIKTFYDTAISTVFEQTDLFIQGVGYTLASIAFGTLQAFGCVSAPAALPEAGELLFSSVVQFDPVGASPACFSFGAVVTNTTFGELIEQNVALPAPIIATVQSIRESFPSVTSSVAGQLSLGLAIGSVFEGGLLGAVPSTGMWTRFDSGVPENSTLCALLSLDLVANPICTYIDIVEGVVDLIPAASDADALKTFWLGTEAGLFDFTAPITTRGGLAVALEAGNAGIVGLTNQANILSLVQDTVGEGDGAPLVLGSGQIVDYTAPLVSSANAGTMAISVLCSAVGQASDCSYLELLTGASTSALVPAATQAQLGLVVALLNNCAIGGAGAMGSNTSFATCLITSGIGGTPIGPGLTLGDGVASNALGTLYSGAEILETDTIAQAFAKAIPECEDDELDAEAVEGAQALLPPGTALMFIGTLLGLFVLAKPSKVVGIVGGIVGVVGGILFLAGLLGVQAAPVFSAVGADGPLEDNAIVFSLGDAALLATGAIALGIAGPIVLIAGSVIIPKPDAGADIMSGGKY